MTNKSRDKYAYTLVDLETKADAATIEKLKAIQGYDARARDQIISEHKNGGLYRIR